MKALNRLLMVAMASLVGMFVVPILTQNGVEAAGPAAPLTFNRLLKKDEERRLPPLRDGIHDPEGQGGALLQPPAEALAGLPDGNGGNYVDWVKALESGKVKDDDRSITIQWYKKLYEMSNIVKDVQLKGRIL